MPSTTVGTDAAQTNPQTPHRQTIYFRNASAGGQKLYGDITPPGGLTTTNAGYILDVGEWLAFSLLVDGPDIQNAWSWLSDGAGATLYYRETNTPSGLPRGSS